MVLARDKALRRADFSDRLVVRAMAVFQLICIGSCRTGKKLVTKTDTHTRTYLFVSKEFSNVFHSLAALLWIARSIGQKQSIEVELVKVIVPWNTNNLNAPSYQTTDDVSLDTAIHKYNTLRYL